MICQAGYWASKGTGPDCNLMHGVKDGLERTRSRTHIGAVVASLCRDEYTSNG
jgi:hypothetical protein